jgi:hypothetical protein
MGFSACLAQMGRHGGHRKWQWFRNQPLVAAHTTKCAACTALATRIHADHRGAVLSVNGSFYWHLHSLAHSSEPDSLSGGYSVRPAQLTPASPIDKFHTVSFGEWASDARQQECRGFSDAPRRTRRAPFDTHRALHRCLGIGGTGITTLLITHDAYSAKRDRNSLPVAPTKRTLERWRGLCPPYCFAISRMRASGCFLWSHRMMVHQTWWSRAAKTRFAPHACR